MNVNLNFLAYALIAFVLIVCIVYSWQIPNPTSYKIVGTIYASILFMFNLLLFVKELKK